MQDIRNTRTHNWNGQGEIVGQYDCANPLHRDLVTAFEDAMSDCNAADQLVSRGCWIDYTLLRACVWSVAFRGAGMEAEPLWERVIMVQDGKVFTYGQNG